MNAETTINEFKKNVGNWTGGTVDVKGVITGLLNRACGGDANRYLFLKALTNKTSSKLLSESEWYGLLLLVEPEKPVGGRWQSAKGDDELYRLCSQVIYHSIHAAGQAQFKF